MTYKIIKTSLGPVIQYKDSYVTLQDVPALIDIMSDETNPDFADAMKKHIIESITKTTDEIIEAFTDNIQHAPNPLYGYVNAMSAFMVFLNHHWGPFQAIKAQEQQL